MRRFGAGPPSRGDYDSPSSVYLDRLEFFRELARRTEVMGDLRRVGLPNVSRERVQEWARAHHLDVPWVVDTLVESLRVWQRYLETGYDPHRREDPLSSFTVVRGIRLDTDPRDVIEVLEEVTTPLPEPTALDRPPDPERETRADYLDRAAAAWEDAAEEVEQRGRNPLSARYRTMNDVEGEPHRAFRWLVSYQVEGKSWSAIAADEQLGKFVPEKQEWTGRREVAVQVKPLAKRIGLSIRTG